MSDGKASHPPIGWELHIGPNLTQMKVLRDSTKMSSRSRGTRKESLGFSRRSQLLFSKRLAQTDWPEYPVHITITHQVYENISPTKEYDPLKSDLEALQKFIKRLSNQKDRIIGYWRIEFHRRQADKFCYLVPHYHLLVTMTDDQQDQISRWWKKRTRNQHRAAIDIRKADTAMGSWYLALHQAGHKSKQSPSWIKIGSWWGALNSKETRKFIKMDRVGELTEGQAVQVSRLIRKFTGGKLRAHYGITSNCFVPRSEISRFILWKEQSLEQVPYSKVSKRWSIIEGRFWHDPTTGKSQLERASIPLF